jgi:hypothetical protein
MVNLALIAPSRRTLSPDAIETAATPFRPLRFGRRCLVRGEDRGGTGCEDSGMTGDGRPRESPGWLLDELAFAGRENLDAEHVARYDGKEDAGAQDEVAVLKRWGMTDRAVVVEFGAGTGQFTIAVARACARVVAVDVSPIMLDRLRANVAAAGLSNVEVVRAGLRPTNMLANHLSSSTHAWPSTTCLTPGRRSRWHERG